MLLIAIAITSQTSCSRRPDRERLRYLVGRYFPLTESSSPVGRVNVPFLDVDGDQSFTRGVDLAGRCPPSRPCSVVDETMTVRRLERTITGAATTGVLVEMHSRDRHEIDVCTAGTCSAVQEYPVSSQGKGKFLWACGHEEASAIELEIRRGERETTEPVSVVLPDALRPELTASCQTGVCTVDVSFQQPVQWFIAYVLDADDEIVWTTEMQPDSVSTDADATHWHVSLPQHEGAGVRVAVQALGDETTMTSAAQTISVAAEVHLIEVL